MHNISNNHDNHPIITKTLLIVTFYRKTTSHFSCWILFVPVFSTRTLALDIFPILYLSVKMVLILTTIQPIINPLAVQGNWKNNDTSTRWSCKFSKGMTWMIYQSSAINTLNFIAATFNRFLTYNTLSHVTGLAISQWL